MKYKEKKMDNVQRRDMELPYIADDEVCEQQKKARTLTQKLNSMDRSDFDGIRAVVKELLGKSEDLLINPPFYCDYGFHIEIGDGCLAAGNPCRVIREITEEQRKYYFKDRVFD